MTDGFHTASERIAAGDVAGLGALLRATPALAREVPEGRASLLQDVAVNGGLGRVANQFEMARILVDAGADLEAPLVAAASVGNLAMGELLVAAGATPGGVGAWTPLEEALYWRHTAFASWLVDRGVPRTSLRVTAGFGDSAGLAAFFDDVGGLLPGQGIHAWPFGALPAERHSDAPDDVLGNALVFAAVNGQVGTAGALLARGAPLDHCPPGTHYQGSPLHAAIWKGGLEMVRFLVERGADLGLRDLEHQGTALGWALHLEKPEVAAYLESRGGPP